MQPEEWIACLCQHVVEDKGKEYLAMVVSLPDGDHAIRFQQATQEIEATIENAHGCILDYRVGPVPPEELPGQGTLAGVILGPERRSIPEAQQDAAKAAFFGACIEILESYGLKEEKGPVAN